MGYWKRHQNKDLENVLREFDRHGFRIEDPPKYYTLRCPCGQHQRQFHRTPSSRHYGNHALKWAARLPCWVPKDDDQDGGKSQ